MTIAVSTTVFPSRILACMLVLLIIITNGIIAYICFGLEINTPTFLLLIIGMGLIDLFLLLKFCKKQQSIRLDISSSGDIILRICKSSDTELVSLNVKLTGDSTLWSQLLILHLQSDDGRVYVVIVLRDCVDTNTFRKLSVALHWIAMHASASTALGADVSLGNF